MRLGANRTLSRGPRRPLLPNLENASFTHTQKQALDAKAQFVDRTPAYVNPDLSFYNPPADNSPFTVTPAAGAPNYPGVGALPIVVISWMVPVGMASFIRELAIVHIGGNDPSFSGQVIWRVLKNGAGIRGLNQLTATYGTFAAPKPVVLFGVENDIFSVTVELPALLPNGNANAPMPAGSQTAASFDGWTYPINQTISVTGS